jgi:hypothetical protein
MEIETKSGGYKNNQLRRDIIARSERFRIFEKKRDAHAKLVEKLHIKIGAYEEPFRKAVINL